jgi:hypothetical protein
MYTVCHIRIKPRLYPRPTIKILEKTEFSGVSGLLAVNYKFITDPGKAPQNRNPYLLKSPELIFCADIPELAIVAASGHIG